MGDIWWPPDHKCLILALQELSHVKTQHVIPHAIASSVQGPSHREQALEHQHGKDALPVLCCWLPTIIGLAVDQLLHGSAEECSGSDPKMPSCCSSHHSWLRYDALPLASTAGLSPKNHSLQRADWSQSWWIWTQFKEHSKPGRCGWSHLPTDQEETHILL